MHIKSVNAYVVHNALYVARNNHYTSTMDWKREVSHERALTFILTVLFHAYIIKRFLLVGVARVYVIG